MIVSKIPLGMRQRQSWCVWRYVVRDGKSTKVPFQPNGHPASSVDQNTWSKLDDCLAVVDGYDGLGFVFSDSDCIMGVDLDGCIGTDGVVQEWAKSVVKQLGSYAEVSPSGTGIKIFGSTGVRWPHRKKIGVDAKQVGEKAPGIEVYDSGRYFCVTGKRLAGCTDILPIDEYFDWIASQFHMENHVPIVDGGSVSFDTSTSERAARYVEKMEPSISGQSGHNKCFAAACALVKGFDLSDSDALMLLVSSFNPRCDPPWSERELQHKIRQARKQPGASGYLRDARPDQWSKIRLPGSYREAIETSEVHEPTKKAEVRVGTVAAAAKLYLDDLKAGKKHLIESGIPDLDYAIGGGFAMGEMVVIAARPSHGKSMVALQMAHKMTADGMPVAMVSEEMSALALGKRAIQFVSNVQEEHWATRFEEVSAQLDNHFSKRADAIIIESCGTVERACEEIEKQIEAIGVKVGIVDYAQLLRAKGGNRYEQISAVSSSLRMFASRTGILLIVLAQLNRSIEERSKFEPKMSDIKETGQLEQDADVILFGVWPHRVDNSQDPKLYQMFVAKNRNRRINEYTFDCTFDGARQMLSEQQVRSEAWAD